MLKLPEGVKLNISTIRYNSPVRPKHLVVVTVSGKDGEVESYARSLPFALAFRVLLARRRALVAYKKLAMLKKFLQA